MAEFVNLRAARKAKDRSKSRAKADENAIKFGRTKDQRASEASDATRARLALDGKALDKPEGT